MNLAAPLNVVLRAPFHLENNKSAPIAVGFEITPFVSEDGAQLVNADVAFDPPSLELRPGQEEKIELILPVGGGFRPTVAYFATVTVTGLDATQLLVRLLVEEPLAAKPPGDTKPAEPPRTTTPAEPPRDTKPSPLAAEEISQIAAVPKPVAPAARPGKRPAAKRARSSAKPAASEKSTAAPRRPGSGRKAPRPRAARQKP
jgi:hypothetical protein